MLAASANSKSKLLRNFFSLSLVQFANNFLPILTVPIVARIIGPEKFGAINFSAAIITYFTLLINYGFDLTATRSIAQNPTDLDKRNQVFSEILFAKIFLLCVSLTLFVPSLFLVKVMAQDKELFIYTYIACFSLVLTPNWLYQGMQELHQIALFNLVSKALFTFSILLIVTKQQDYIFQPLILSVSQIFVGICSFIWAIKKYRIRILKVHFSKIVNLLWTEKMIFFSMIVVMVYTTTNTIILGFVQSTTEVAFYSAGWKLIMIIQTFVSTPLKLSLFPFVGESFGKSNHEGVVRIKQILPFISIFTAVSGIFIWFLAPWLISMFYGAAFSEAATVLRILCFVPFVLALGDLFGIQTMINLKMDKPFFNITLSGAILSIILNFLLAKQLGAIGTAWAWLLTESTITIIMWLFLFRKKIQLVDWNYFSYSHLSGFIRPIIFVIRSKMNRGIVK
jgi:O-antigen/teichoic acid export membrane protein